MAQVTPEAMVRAYDTLPLADVNAAIAYGSFGTARSVLRAGSC
jgi:hypothetical protein